MQECDDLSELQGNTGKDIMLWSVETVTKYNYCKLRHSGLIKALK